MAFYINCDIEKTKDPSKIDVLVEILEDFRVVFREHYVLPEDQSKFLDGTHSPSNFLYSTGSKRVIPALFSPKSSTKTEAKLLFKQRFLDYVCGLNRKTMNIDAVNTYLNDLFLPKLDSDILSMHETLQKKGAALKQTTKEIKNQSAKILTEYNTRKAAEATQPQAGLYVPQNVPTENQVVVGEIKAVSDKKAPAINNNTLTNEERDRQSKLPADLNEDRKGIGFVRLVEPISPLLRHPGDKLVEGENNSGALFSRDEQYGMKGHTGAGAAYLYAGRNPHKLETEEQDSSISPSKNTVKKMRIDLITDASYLYLSQKSNADDLLKAAGGSYAKYAAERTGESVAAMKADGVVIMARQSGIRLITGGDKKTARGTKPSAIFGIDLIAGNEDEDLQPLVKGKNLVLYLKGLSKAIDNLAGVTYDFLTSQLVFNAVLATHSHYDPFLVFLGTMTSGPLTIMGGKGFPSPEAAQQGTKALLEQLKQQSGGISQALNQINNNLNGLENIGAYNILSDRNRTN
tara:strand:- start:31360 stop:32910 length:1551 start_codon:yes stop_codon:yes gene_type:complete